MVARPKQLFEPLKKKIDKGQKTKTEVADQASITFRIWKNSSYNIGSQMR